MQGAVNLMKNIIQLKILLKLCLKGTQCTLTTVPRSSNQMFFVVDYYFSLPICFFYLEIFHSFTYF